MGIGLPDWGPGPPGRHGATVCTLRMLRSSTRQGHFIFHTHPARRSRKTLIYLILTLNHTYPDYDFSLLRAHHFRKEAGVKAIEETVGSALLEVSRVRCLYCSASDLGESVRLVRY